MTQAAFRSEHWQRALRDRRWSSKRLSRAVRISCSEPQIDHAAPRLEGRRETFTILSTNALLIEVSGDGPIFDVPGGLTIPDGAATRSIADLHRAPVRRWRVDGPHTVQTMVVVTDSPYGAFVALRRCDLNELGPWRDVGEGTCDQVWAQGGDLAVVSFIVP